MALMGLLFAMGPSRRPFLHPVHVDHGLRPESRDDATWVVGMIRAHWGLETEVVTMTVNPDPGESVEMAARRLRYAALHRVAERWGSSSRIVVAHHYDDQVETILMRILVGTGIAGLGGMRPIQGRVVRPLLEIRRDTLHRYLEDNRIPWLEDSTNTDRAILRNRIRHDILPLLATQVNPRVDLALTRLADQARDTSEEMSQWVKDFLNDQGIDLNHPVVVLPAELRACPKSRLLAIFSQYGMLHNLRLSKPHLDQALQSDVTWPRGVMVRHHPDRIELVLPSKTSGHTGFQGADITPLPEGEVIDFRGTQLIMTRASEPQVAGPGERTSRINAARWPTVAVRGWRAGDAMRPIGLNGTKKLQDLFVDSKIPRPWRHRWPIITGGSGEGAPILAVVGLALSEDAKPEVGSESYWIRWIPHFNGD